MVNDGVAKAVLALTKVAGLGCERRMALDILIPEYLG